MHNKEREDSFRLLKLEGDLKNNFIGLRTFIENIIGDYSSTKIKPNDFQLRKEESSSKKFTELEDSSTLYRKCIFSQEVCVFAFLNGDWDKESRRINLNFRNQLKILDKVSKETFFNQLYYVNATCYDEFSQTFKVRVSSMPTMAIYNPQTKMYSKMKSDQTFDKKGILDFLSEVSGKNVFMRKLEDKDVNFKERYCKEKTTKSKDVDFDKLDRINAGLEDDDQEEEENLALKPDL